MAEDPSSGPSKFTRAVNPDSQGTPGNRPGIKHDGAAKEFERGAPIARSYELKSNPVEQTFDVRHVQQIHKHLYQGISRSAGEFTAEVAASLSKAPAPGQQSERSELDRMYEGIRSRILVPKLGKEAFVSEMAKVSRDLHSKPLFYSGNEKTFQIFMTDLAHAGKYHLDLTKVSMHDWQEAHHRMNHGGRDAGDGVMLRSIIRENTRPLRALQFESAVFYDYRRGAIREFPELGRLFKAFDEATKQAGFGKEEDRGTMKSPAYRIFRSVQNRLNEGMDPDSMTDQALSRMMEVQRSRER